MEDYHIMEAFENKAMAVFEEEVIREEQIWRDTNSSRSNQTKSLNDSDSKQTPFEYKKGMDIKEFSHSQYQLHQEFLKLFEQLISKFLEESAYTADEVYDAVYVFAQQKKKEQASLGELQDIRTENQLSKLYANSDNDDDVRDQNPEKYAASEAHEIVDVLSFYTDFALWSEMMMDNARHRQKYKHLAQSKEHQNIQYNADIK